LIRDTEPHERALFSLDPDAVKGASGTTRKSIAVSEPSTGGFGRKSTFPLAQPQKQSAVARVLGTEMLRQIRQSSRNSHRQKGVDVEVLLEGAEKLCAVYSVAGAPEKIATLRNRYGQARESIAMYEEKVSRQQSKLDQMNRGFSNGGELNEFLEDTSTTTSKGGVSDQDLEYEEHEVRELEARKKALEERVAEMERDLGGLRD